MKNKTARFLLISIVCVSLLCVAVFSFMLYRMNRKSAEAIGDLGSLYMTNISKQAATHFGSTFELRLSQVSGLTDAVPPDRTMRDDVRRTSLNYYARLRGFDHLAFCKADGSFEMLYGSQIDADLAFAEALAGGEDIMAVGKDVHGGEFVLMGVPAAYPTQDGTASVALVAALPISYIRDMLSVNTESASIYYILVGKGGEIILHDGTREINETDYFDRVQKQYGTIKKDGAEIDKETYIAEFREAMKEGGTYSVEFTLEGERRFLYASSLPGSDWYLCLFLPYGPLNTTVNALGDAWVRAAVLSCVVILAVLLVVFAFYFWLTHKHVRELEETRKAAEHASKAKSEFLSNMSHDIRTPMNGIVGMTTIALANLDHREQVKNCLDKISVSSRHLLGLINDILDMSKIESGKLEIRTETVSLKDLMRNVVNIIQPQVQAKGHTLHTELGELSCEYVRSDGIRLNQILLNLLGNAVKFTPEGGQIYLSCVEEQTDKEGYIRIHFRVRDTGIGMSEEFQKKVFEAFAREDSGRVRQIEGTGLGMTITKYIVDAMQGSIGVKSAPGEGTEFHVVLDFTCAEGENKPAPEEETSTDFNGKRVLLAEDNELNMEIAEELLSEMGFTVDCAVNGKICAEMFAASEVNFYDVIFMDIRMPVMNGYEATEEIRAMDRPDARSVPIIAMSADAFSDDVARCLACGMNAHTAKPIDMKVVCKLLNEFLADRGGE